MRGRKPKPTHLRLVTGNPGKRPLNDREARVTPERPSAPDLLKGEARKEWFRITRLLSDAGLLTKLDRAVVAGYCVAWARWLECEKMVEERGMILRSPNGIPIYSPYLSASNRAMEQLRQYAEQMGLSGSARSRIKAIETPASLDPAEAFLRGRA